jgi:hypothetical protein
VRKYIKPWKKDRYMSPDIELAASLIQNNKIWNVAKEYIVNYNNKKNGELNNLSSLSSLFD